MADDGDHVGYHANSSKHLSQSQWHRSIDREEDEQNYGEYKTISKTDMQKLLTVQYSES